MAEELADVEINGDFASPRVCVAYTRSLSDLALFIACTLSSVPSLVSDGFVLGAEIWDELARRPWEIVPTGIGDLLAGLSLS